MQISIESSGVDPPDVLEEYVLRRLEFVLKRFEDDIQQVTVHLVDGDGSKWEANRTCQIIAELRDGRTITVEERQAGFSSAVWTWRSNASCTES